MFARSSRPMASSTAPKRIGTQMARLNIPIFAFLRGLSVEPDEIRHEDEDAQQHREGIVVDIAGLHPAHDAGHAADGLPRAVDDGTVDDALVAAFPQAGAHR